ncbi:MAG TPA: hypothetical protein V6C71_22330 [Coleofasciculaceae cyanobacterium]|jgi:hypothetical protein
MNQANNLSSSILLIISATIFAWTNPLNSPLAIAQTSLVPAPSLQNEQPKLLTSETNTLPTEVQSAVLNDAVKRTSKTVAALKIIEAQSQEWSDGCLGLGKPNQLCTQAIVPGWQVVVTDGLRNWTYRTDNTGNTVRLEQLD